MTMNLDIVKNIHSTSFASTQWDEFVSQLEKGLKLIENAADELHKRDISDLTAANIALSYNREVMLHMLMN